MSTQDQNPNETKGFSVNEQIHNLLQHAKQFLPVSSNIDIARSKEVTERFETSNSAKESLADLREYITDTQLSPEARFLALCRYDERVGALRMVAGLPESETLLQDLHATMAEENQSIFDGMADSIYENGEKIKAYWRNSAIMTDENGKVKTPPALEDIARDTITGRVPSTIKKSNVSLGAQPKTTSARLLKAVGEGLATAGRKNLEKILGLDKQSQVPYMMQYGLLAKIARQENISKYQINVIRSFAKRKNGIDAAHNELRLANKADMKAIFTQSSPYEQELQPSRRFLQLWIQIKSLKEDPNKITELGGDLYNNASEKVRLAVAMVKASDDPVGLIRTTVATLATAGVQKGVQSATQIAGHASDLLRRFGNRNKPPMS